MNYNILVLVRYTIKNGRRNEFLNALSLSRIAEDSRAENGNLRYDVALCAEAENDVLLTEIWVNAKAQELHKTTPHYEKLCLLKTEYVEKVEITKRRICEDE